MQLSEHFSLAELVRSPTALRLGINNTPSSTVIAALTALCLNLLEPVRAHFGPVAITSGYRAPAVNRAVGGAATSKHCLGEAADFTVPGQRNIDVAQWIQRNVGFDQLIYEFGEEGWVHASWRHERRRHQELTARRIGRRVQYLPGLRPDFD
jgi:hypothetical protein